MTNEQVKTRLQLGELLRQKGIVTEEQIQSSLERQRSNGHKKLLGEILVEEGYCNDNQIAAAIAEAENLPYALITPKLCDASVVELLPRDFLDEHVVLPLFKVHDTLTVAVSEPSNLFLIDEIKRITQCELQLVCGTVRDIKSTLQTYMPSANVFVIDDIIDDTEIEDFSLIENIAEDISDLEKVAGQSPVVKLVNYLLYNAVRENASDIHIEPDEKRLRIRYRVDGRLYEKMTPPYQMHAAIVSRIKIMAELDIAQRRLPQDGGIHVLMEGRSIDLRVSVMPGNYGEKVVIRIIDARKILSNLESLGFSMANLEKFKNEIKSSHGIVLVTGPTGSGKNTTLYGALAELNNEQVNICTVEDPVECNLTGVNQFQVNDMSGFTFAKALRSLLRQDPDIIMVGEIRDQDTANIATQAALTGHLVLSTLHTNDAPGAVTRLIDLNVQPFLVSASLIAVLAQRLVRKVCPNCKEDYEPPASIKKTAEKWSGEIEHFYRGVGCRKCRNTGYLGRMAIHELLVPDENMLDMITQGATLKELRSAALDIGMVPLHIDGMEKVKAGITTIDEVIRVTNVGG